MTPHPPHPIHTYLKRFYGPGAVVQKLLASVALIPLLFFAACPNPTDDPVAPAVTGVTVSSERNTIVKGETLQFTATVAGTNNPAEAVTWTVEGGGAGTSASDLLAVAADETLTTLTVRPRLPLTQASTAQRLLPLRVSASVPQAQT